MQFDPVNRYFEEKDKTLLFSGSNGVPLIRYHIADNGGVLSYEEMLTFLKKYNFDPIAVLQETPEGKDNRFLQYIPDISK